MGISRWTDKLKRFGALNGADKCLLLRTAGWLAAARIQLLITPFKRLAARLSVAQGSNQHEADPKVLSSVAWAVAAAANNVPWRSDCFPQTLAARKLLSGYGYSSTIHIGVERVGEGDLEGHAWLTCGEAVVTGGGELDRYTEVHTFST